MIVAYLSVSAQYPVFHEREAYSFICLKTFEDFICLLTRHTEFLEIMNLVFSATLTFCCFAIFSQAQKQRSWLESNNFLTLQNNSSRLVSPFYSLVTESNGKVYGFGGLPGSQGNKPMTINRYKIIVCNSFLYLAIFVAALLDNRFYEYDPATRTWTDLTDLLQFGKVTPPARKAHGLSSSNGKIYVFGGQTNISGMCNQLGESRRNKLKMLFQVRYQGQSRTISIAGTHLL